jgi:hypothetical protein
MGTVSKLTASSVSLQLFLLTLPASLGLISVLFPPLLGASAADEGGGLDASALFVGIADIVANREILMERRNLI